MKSIIKPSVVKGSVTAPPSKSVAQRAIAMAGLVQGKSTINNVGTSKDVQAAINLVRQLGATVTGDENSLTVEGNLTLPDSPLLCGESGLSIRMFTGISSLFSSKVELLGEKTLLNRPMPDLEHLYAQLGARVKTSNGFAPITVKGPFLGGQVHLESLSGSQSLTGVLIASPLALFDTTIYIKELPSKQYVDLTIDTMEQFGISIERSDYTRFHIPSGQFYKPSNINIEGDWSNAAFLLVAAAIAGQIRVDNLSIQSKQPDRAIIDVLMWVGAKLSIYDTWIEAEQQELLAFDFDARNAPDLFPPLVALAAHCQGESKILGVSRLKTKESDRAQTLKDEFGKLGVEIAIQGDLMRIKGGSVTAGTVQSHGDHRIAMACAIVALKATGGVTIEDSDCVEKSYPQFFSHLQSITQES